MLFKKNSKWDHRTLQQNINATSCQAPKMRSYDCRSGATIVTLRMGCKQLFPPFSFCSHVHRPIHRLKCSVLKFIQLGPIIVLGLLKCTIQRRAQTYLCNLKTKHHFCCEGSKRPIVASNSQCWVFLYEGTKLDLRHHRYPEDNINWEKGGVFNLPVKKN